MLTIFTVKYEEKSESFPDSSMSRFLADKEVLKWEGRFFEHKGEYFWTVLVEYRPVIPSASATAQKTKEKSNDGYKEILGENDWPLFKVLREWRGERSKEEGIPPYIICTNMQLASITVARPASLNSLQEINGIGSAKTEKYGVEILGIIASHGKAVGNGGEGENG